MNRENLLPDSTQEDLVRFGARGSSLVLAGPGCGKTSILARRLHHAHTVEKIPFRHMLCLTFSNRAARAMRARATQYLGKRPAGLFIGNIHKFCLAFLHANGLLSPETSILDEEDRDVFLHAALGLDSAKAIRAFLETAIWIYQTDHDHPAWVTRRPAVLPSVEVYGMCDAYRRFKEENKLVDFDDILLRTYTALQSRDAADFRFTGYTWVQVDEVQDMTPLQLAIVDAVSSRRNRTAMFLGDEQQAIFSFAGAGGRALDIVKGMCGDNIFRLRRNYRSTAALVEMCNSIATRWLGISAALLPDPSTALAEGSLSRMEVPASSMAEVTAQLARKIAMERPGEDLGILVRTNAEGEDLAEALDDAGISFFHVGRKDAFASVPFKTIWSHISALVSPLSYQPWARILFQTRTVRTLSGARELVRLLSRAALPTDHLLDLDTTSDIAFFNATFTDPDKTIVVLDTETTGLDVYADDIVQIAALKMRGGHIVAGSRFEIFIRSDRPIPRHLSGGVPNPLAYRYLQVEKHEPEEALELLSGYIGDDSVIAGHNLKFDLEILRQAWLKHANGNLPAFLLRESRCIDTLTISKLIYPELRSHRLGFLGDVLNLKGNNSHLADEDVELTAELIGALATPAAEKCALQDKVTAHPNVRKAAALLSRNYGPLYRHHRRLLDETRVSPGNSLAAVMAETHDYMVERKYTDTVRHFDYILALIAEHIVRPEEPTFAQQASNHLFDLISYNESDLFDKNIIRQRISVMTVHKAKGLEWDNVIVFNPGSRIGPVIDHARLLYVAFSRARRHLYTITPPNPDDPVFATAQSCFKLIQQHSVGGKP